MLEQIGETLTAMGMQIIPYSFAAFFPVRWLEYFWRLGYATAIKGIWYFALGTLYLTDHVQVGVVVVYICFIEAWDLFVEQLERKRARRERRAVEDITAAAE